MAVLLDILLWAGAAIWMVFLIIGVLNALLVPDLSRISTSEPEAWPFVSFVVPARNEEAGIRRAVESFCAQDYPAFEVVVVNDRSTDATGEILSQLESEYPQLIVAEGEEPPEGWLGKPNALEIGRARARGDWILMTDADAVHAPDLLRRAVAFGIAEGAGMVVVRPRHVTHGVLEAVLMSGVNFFFFVTTPLFLVRYSRSAWFSTGSPVFNLIRRDALESCGGFACLKRAIVDDLEIGFFVKQGGYRLAVAFAGSLIGHRMYSGAAETVKGFGKTTYPTIRNVGWLLPVYVVFGLVISVLPYVGFVGGLMGDRLILPAALSLGFMHLVLAGMAWRYREPWYVAFLNPLRELGWLWIFLRSYVVYRRKGLLWRGRSYQPSS